MRKYHNVVQDAAGNAIANPTVYVRLRSTGGLATLYRDDGITTLANPLTGDVTGYFEFYVADGNYDLEIRAGNITEFLLDEEVIDPDAFSRPIKAPQVNVGDANARIKRIAQGLHLENVADSSTVAGLSSVNAAANATWDGTNWNRIDTAQPASLQVVDRSGTLNVYTAAAGANPIAWSGPYPVMRGGMSHAAANIFANQSIAAATFTKVAFAAEGVDILGNYDTSLYRFVAPELGIYDISASALFTGNADGVRSLLTIYYNGAESRRGSDAVQGGAADVTVTVGTTIRMAAGDYVEIFAYCSAASTLLANGGVTWLSISRVQ